jgi:hypothetical protein
MNPTQFLLLDSGDPVAKTLIQNNVSWDVSAKRSLEGVPADQAQYLLQERYQLMQETLDGLTPEQLTPENIQDAAAWVKREWGEKAKSAREYYAAEAAKEAESAE